MKPEARLQSWADRFIDKAVLPPMFTTAIEHGAQEYAGNVRRAAQFQARGGKFGLPDAMVLQGDPPRACWIEYKRGSKLDDRQLAVHMALQRAGAVVGVAKCVRDVLLILRSAGFRLHGNADNLAVEYEERLMASDRKAAA